jgi:hypothetical protein
MEIEECAFIVSCRKEKLRKRIKSKKKFNKKASASTQPI